MWRQPSAITAIGDRAARSCHLTHGVALTDGEEHGVGREGLDLPEQEECEQDGCERLGGLDGLHKRRIWVAGRLSSFTGGDVRRRREGRRGARALCAPAREKATLVSMKPIVYGSAVFQSAVASVVSVAGALPPLI